MTDKNMFLKNYSFYGRQCEQVQKLTSNLDDNFKLFQSSIELLIVAAMVGLIFNHTAKPDRDKSKSTTIMSEQFNYHNRELKLVFKYVILLATIDDCTDAEKLKKCLGNPETDENYILFEQYFLGGIEYLADKLLVDTNKTYGDYLLTFNSILDSLKEESDELIDTLDIKADFE